MILEKSELKKDGNSRKCCWDVKSMPFDPNINLKDVSKFKKRVRNIVSDNDEDVL